MSIERKHVGKRLSDVVIHNGTIYLAGMVANDPVPEDPAEQTRDILAQIDRHLAEAGSSKEKILMATIWLSDIRFYDAMNTIWDPWVAAGHAPARACVEARLAHPRYKVEIRVVAAQ
ncbi:MAG: RidA family protein [Betaproteobacteria bacterium]|jgi:enamine deaminase RidA (YjgF/YER057c/UK114 family)|nr:RidA family protein [Rhodocyclaceae bacterium]MCA3133449.1 RidA family protein [Rhodocyclaceae bacterium]MCA3143208.1 RidA family protein [Rhodocyclaceae bacterium]MCA3144662.1 RidA family protein [Rhodocyclaceae bacterium]MCE2896427.1 RidA family protein [Betaproteobacteria bacterium]